MEENLAVELGGIAVRQRHGTADAVQLRAHEPLAQFFAGLRQVKQSLAAVVLAFLLEDIALVDQFLQHAAEALLGDAKDVEQLLHGHAGVTPHEMQHPVVRAPEAELAEDLVRVGHEIAVGKEHQLDERNRFLIAQHFATGLPLRLWACSLGRNYVSHIDIFTRPR